MIKVERGFLPQPKEFNEFLSESRERLEEVYAVARSQRSRRLTKVDPRPFHNFRSHLNEVFRGKCAFCESTERGMTAHDIHWFRPRSDATDLDGKKTSPDHYWWLAHEWENLYIACPLCARKKARRFPVAGKRATVGSKGAALNQEKRQLLDPCGDDPLSELTFLPDGRVKGRSKRAGTTIQVFGLNRQELVKRRRHAAEKMLKIIRVAQKLAETPTGAMTRKERTDFNKNYQQIDALCADDAEFAGLHRQLVSGRSQQASTDSKKGVLHASTGVGLAASGTLGTGADPGGSIWIRSVEIKNFKALPDISIRFPYASTESGDEPWIVLLGENGMGKSSVLKAVALPYLVRENRAELYLDPIDCVRRAPRVKRGRVSIEFSDDTTASVRFGRGIQGFELEGELPDTPILGYGATRLPPPPGHREMAVPQRVSLGNLFDPRVPLRDAEPWFADPQRVRKQTFDKLASSLLTLMAASEDMQIERRSGQLFVRQSGTRLSLREMSDGYQSVLALATDIMVNLAGDWDSMASAEGTVLLDEIEVHLHPRWKMAIVGALRAVFPKIRFIVSTHDPLCIQSLRDGELHRLYYDDEKQGVTCLQLDVPKGLRADQLLTGQWFGLTTTLDEDTQSMFREYARLVAEPGTAANKRRRKDLRRMLKERTGGVGETAMERVAVGAVAEYVESQPEDTKWDPKEARAAIMQRLNQMTNRVDSTSD